MSEISPVIVLLALVLLIFSTASLILIVYFLPTSYNPKDEASKGPPRYQILVLGDIGRSPRMQYHAISMGKYGGSVDLIGYLGTTGPYSFEGQSELIYPRVRPPSRHIRPPVHHRPPNPQTTLFPQNRLPPPFPHLRTAKGPPPNLRPVACSRL